MTNAEHRLLIALALAVSDALGRLSGQPDAVAAKAGIDAAINALQNDLTIQTVEAIAGEQVTTIEPGSDLATVRYPANRDTVLSIQPDGSAALRPHGTAGPYELCLVKSDRLVYRPVGEEGPTYIVPLAAETPNEGS